MKKIAGLYWVKEEIDSGCFMYNIRIAVTDKLVCSIDADVPSAEVFANLFAGAPQLLSVLQEIATENDDIGVTLCDHEVAAMNVIKEVVR